ncbi:ABC transporter substrate-binding protein [Azospirillum sp. TSO22-1]|uniref:ABC transporter substrate-binding protein n=1 Tax=Azospirillum sp. TSO22-1 TaxID=716789 RepID=UPI000D64717D|nr:ABC transporter substrate-binding protein [Azospirillum sp. TSO22-1]
MIPLKPLALAACLMGMVAGPAAAQQPVRIGVLADMSGFAADIGGAGSVLATKMAVEDFGGRVLDRPVEVIHADIQNSPDIASATARQWFDQGGVDMITDLPVSSVALAVQAVAREKKKVLMISAATTAELTNAQCSPYTVHWADDTHALSVATAKAVVESGGISWYFVAADFAFGAAMQKAASDVITASGGRVLGGVRHPMNAGDFSSYLLAAQGSGANVIGLANVGVDTITTIKQAGEFGISKGGQTIVGFIVFITDVDALGLETAQGLYVTENFYWDQSDTTRAWAKRFQERHGEMPSKEQANTYQATLSWLKAVKAAGTTDSAAVIAKIKDIPLEQFGAPARVREDGRVLYDLALWKVKAPAESKGRWDYYKKVRDIPHAEAFLPLEKSTCPFVKK